MSKYKDDPDLCIIGRYSSKESDPDKRRIVEEIETAIQSIIDDDLDKMDEWQLLEMRNQIRTHKRLYLEGRNPIPPDRIQFLK